MVFVGMKIRFMVSSVMLVLTALHWMDTEVSAGDVNAGVDEQSNVGNLISMWESNGHNGHTKRAILPHADAPETKKVKTAVQPSEEEVTSSPMDTQTANEVDAKVPKPTTVLTVAQLKQKFDKADNDARKERELEKKQKQKAKKVKKAKKPKKEKREQVSKKYIIDIMGPFYELWKKEEQEQRLIPKDKASFEAAFVGAMRLRLATIHKLNWLQRRMQGKLIDKEYGEAKVQELMTMFTPDCIAELVDRSTPEGRQRLAVLNESRGSYSRNPVEQRNDLVLRYTRGELEETFVDFLKQCVVKETAAVQTPVQTPVQTEGNAKAEDSAVSTAEEVL
eukprot:Lankesteria_metandrocarpae@DN3696_c0_g1_i1.p1